MTWYRDIQPLQEPYDLGELDDAGRVQLVFRVVATKRPSATFLQELLTILEDALVGQRRVNLFAGSLALVPTDPEAKGPFLLIMSESGPGPLGTHDTGVAGLRRPAAKITVFGATLPAASVMAEAAYLALANCRNRDVQSPETSA